MNQLVYIIGPTMQRGRSLASKLWIWQPFEIRTQRLEKLSANILNVRISVNFEYFEVWFFVNIFIIALLEQNYISGKNWSKSFSLDISLKSNTVETCLLNKIKRIYQLMLLNSIYFLP